MFRPCRRAGGFLLAAGTRRTKGWKKDEASAMQRHTRKTIYGKKLDVKIVGGESGVSHGATNEARRSTNLLRRMASAGAMASMGSVGEWLQAVRFTEWRNIAHMLYPSLWGVGFGCTNVLVLEAADMVVLNMPLLPMHLMGQFLMAAWNAQCAATLYEELVHRRVGGGAPRNDMTNTALFSATMTHGVFAMLMMLNMHPTVPMIAVSVLPLALIYPIVWRNVPQDTKGKLFLRQVHRGVVTNVGAALGYVAVVGRFDPVVVGGIWLSGIAWTYMYDNLDLMTTENVSLSLKEVPFLVSDMKAGLSLMLPVVYGGLSVAAWLTGQSFLYLVASAVSVAYMASMLDHMNLGDSWSVANTSWRITRLGLLLVFSIMIGNLFWVISFLYSDTRPYGIDVQEPATQPLNGTTFGQVLSMNTKPAERFVVEGELAITERLAKPALVHKHIMQKQRNAMTPGVPTEDEVAAKETRKKEATAAGGGEEDSAAAEDGDEDMGEMPAYMRRERLVENLATLARACVPASRLEMYERWWYGVSDHYNIVGRVW